MGTLTRKIERQPSIETLKPLQQEILQLRFAYGMHSVEIGKRLNKNATTIRSILSRTLNTLRLQRAVEPH
ncbi:hypothetical protein ccbrp13_25400 [Ktedonobacteria bacterium brp13]|nr:hypothetical protein ccbrp13_25400 [Ktedonobacteria bacterium brp13]